MYLFPQREENLIYPETVHHGSWSLSLGWSVHRYRLGEGKEIWGRCEVFSWWVQDWAFVLGRCSSTAAPQEYWVAGGYYAVSLVRSGKLPELAERKPSKDMLCFLLLFQITTQDWFVCSSLWLCPAHSGVRTTCIPDLLPFSFHAVLSGRTAHLVTQLLIMYYVHYSFWSFKVRGIVCLFVCTAGTWSSVSYSTVQRVKDRVCFGLVVLLVCGLWAPRAWGTQHGQAPLEW